MSDLILLEAARCRLQTKMRRFAHSFILVGITLWLTGLLEALKRL
jgi:hypothetical protein